MLEKNGKLTPEQCERIRRACHTQCTLESFEALNAIRVPGFILSDARRLADKRFNALSLFERQVFAAYLPQYRESYTKELSSWVDTLK